jgi:acetoin utilization protein AcuC
MTDRKAVFIHSSELNSEGYPEACPFKSHRAGITRDIALSMGLLSGQNKSEISPCSASRPDLEKFHTKRYLDALEQAANGHLDAEAFQMGIGTPDCPVFSKMYQHAVIACGGTLTGAQLLLDSKTDVAFNPSGGFHHAGPEAAAGFCYVNDVVLGCLSLAGAGMKVLFVDLDAHHGDGVQNAFYDRQDVMTISLHESGTTLFPGTGFEEEIGEGPGKGYCVNVPLPAGTDDEAFVRGFKAIALPLIHAYNSDVIVLELGMDGLAGDPLAHLSLTNNAYADVVKLVMKTAKPALAVGGGGYNIENTTRSWALLWSILCNEYKRGEEMMLGLGGVMLQSTDWLGGLRDRVLITSDDQRREIDQALGVTIEKVKRLVFPIHGL